MNSRFSAGDPEYQPVARFVLDQFGRVPSLKICSRDPTYLISETICGSRTLGLMSYFRSGMQIADAVHQLTSWHFRSAVKSIQLFEFGCGYGRSTRFLAAGFGPDNVWASDLSPEALEFQTSEFQIQPLLSEAKPEAFKPGIQWDCIFVSSLFNGLSEVDFTRWLWKFHSLLSPGGLLIFTAGNAEHSVPLGFVHQAIIAVTGSLDHTRIPQGLCFTHDLFAIAKGQLRTEPIHFQYGPNGCVDSCRWTEPYQMKLSGWAHDVTPGESIAKIAVYYNEILRGSGAINHNRPDVAQVPTGWDCVADLTGEQIRPAHDWLLVKAISTSGREWVLRLDHPANIGEFESMPGWEYDGAEGCSRAIFPVLRFVDYPANGHFTSEDTTLSGWIATPNADHLDQIALFGRFGNIPYTIVERPDVYAHYHMASLGFQTILPPEYLTASDPRLRFITRSGVVLTTIETVVRAITPT